MKNIFKILSVLSIFLLVFSCQERDTDPRIGEDAITAAKFVNPPTGAYTVTAINLVNPFHTFILDRASYGTAIELTYQLEISDTKTFTKVANLGESDYKTNIEVTYQQLNSALAELALTANEPHDVYVRLKATPKNSLINSSYSDYIKFTVTPYEPNYDLMFDSIAVPGNYGGASGFADWSPDNSPRLYSPKNDDKYVGFVWMNSATPEFKFTYANEGWANNKGDSSDPNTYTTLAPNGPNIKGLFPNTTYFFKVDWAGNTYSVQKGEFGIIGEATPTGWGSDTNLTFDTTSKKYVIASMALTGGKIFKFRANDAWDMKIQPQNSDVTLVSGKAVQVYNSGEGTVTGDPNFVVPTSGNYKIELDLHNSGHYTLTITKL